jgi:hypothetical protein
VRPLPFSDSIPGSGGRVGGEPHLLSYSRSASRLASLSSGCASRGWVVGESAPLSSCTRAPPLDLMSPFQLFVAVPSAPAPAGRPRHRELRRAQGRSGPAPAIRDSGASPACTALASSDGPIIPRHVVPSRPDSEPRPPRGSCPERSRPVHLGGGPPR